MEAALTQLGEGVQHVAAGEDSHEPPAVHDGDRADTRASHEACRVGDECARREGDDVGRHHVLDRDRRWVGALPLRAAPPHYPVDPAARFPLVG